MVEAHAFVNVGVWHGFTFLSGLVGNDTKRYVFGIHEFCVRDKVDARGQPEFGCLEGAFIAKWTI